MNKLLIVKIISFLAMAVAAMVVVGWVFDISILKSIYPSWVSMKFTTAVSFLLSGIALYLMVLSAEGKGKALDFLPFVAITIFLLMATLFISSIVGIRTGIEDLFVKEAVGAVKSATPGRPSIPTMLAFIFISFAGFFATFDQKRFKNMLFLLGIVIAVIGIIPIAGYTLHIPLLYYYIPGINTAIALHTALLFIVIGIGLILLAKGELKDISTVTTIKSRLTIAFLIIGLISALFLGFISIASTGNALRDEITNKLLLITESKEGQVYAYLDSLESRTIDFSSDGFIRDSVKEIANGSTEAATALNEHLINNKKPLDENLFCIMIFDSNGKVVSSVFEEEIGNDESLSEQFIGGKEGVFTGKETGEAESESGKTMISVGAPITDKNTGKLLGVIINTFTTDKLGQVLSGEFQIQKGALSSSQGLTQTLAIHLINKEKKVLSHGHKETGHIVDMIDTLPVQQCLNNQKEMAGEYLNHLGEKVIGASRCLPQRGWTLLTEINSSEALAPLRAMQFGLGIFTVIILIFIIFAAFISANKISNPIKTLHEGTNTVAKGNLDYRVDIKTGDEIEQLGNAFNEMTANLKKSRQVLEEYAKGLEQKVAERTEELSSKLKDLGETQEAMLNVAEDTEREKQNVTSERDKINAILYSIGDGVFVINSQEKVILFNRAAESISGFPAKEVVGKQYHRVLKFVLGLDEKVNDKFIKDTLATGKAQEMTNHTILIRKDGTKLAVADSAAPLKDKDNQIIGCVVVFRDVGREREIDRMKTEFISLASHQLRTPLSAMKWFGEMLLAGDAGKLNKEQVDFVQNIYDSNERMIALVEALLNISRIESGRLIIDPKPTDLRQLVNGLVGELKIKIKEKKQTLVVSSHPNLPKINIDPKLIGNVYQNLLTNASKYSPNNTEVSVFISRKGDEIISQVSDNGYGIPEKEQSKVFDKFYRGGNIVKLETDGTGLGLYLAKSVVESSGGKIWFESKEGKGTTFWFSLPIAGSKPKKGEVGIDI